MTMVTQTPHKNFHMRMIGETETHKALICQKFFFDTSSELLMLEEKVDQKSYVSIKVLKALIMREWDSLPIE